VTSLQQTPTHKHCICHVNLFNSDFCYLTKIYNTRQLNSKSDLSYKKKVHTTQVKNHSNNTVNKFQFETLLISSRNSIAQMRRSYTFHISLNQSNISHSINTQKNYIKLDKIFSNVAGSVQQNTD